MKYYNVAIGAQRCYFCIDESGAKQNFSVTTTSIHDKKHHPVTQMRALHDLVVSARQEQTRLMAMKPVQELIMNRASRVKLAEFVKADPFLIEELRLGNLSPVETKLINLQVLIQVYEKWKNKTMLWEWQECNREKIDLIEAQAFVDIFFHGSQAQLDEFNVMAGKEFFTE